MGEENTSQEFRLRNIGETRNYFLEELKQNELMNKKHKKVCATYWMCFNFCFCFFDWYSYWNSKFCNRIKNLCNNCKN